MYLHAYNVHACTHMSINAQSCHVCIYVSVQAAAILSVCMHLCMCLVPCIHECIYAYTHTVIVLVNGAGASACNHKDLDVKEIPHRNPICMLLGSKKSQRDV